MNALFFTKFLGTGNVLFKETKKQKTVLTQEVLKIITLRESRLNVEIISKKALVRSRMSALPSKTKMF